MDVAQPQLSGTPVSPALQVAVVEDGTGVVTSSRHRNRRAARAKVDRCGWRCVEFGGAAYTQLPVTILPPTLEITVVKDCTGVANSSRNCYCCSASAEVDRCRWRGVDIKVS